MNKPKKSYSIQPTTVDYRILLNTIDVLIEMFQEVEKKAPEMFWWSMFVPEDITLSGGIDVTLYRWAELLQDDYVEDLCNLGGIGNKDANEWTVYAVTGKGVTLEYYKRIADVCTSTVKSLWIPEHAKFKLNVFEHYGGFIKSVSSTKYNKVIDERKSALKALWITEHPHVNFGVSEYLDGFDKGKNSLSDTVGGASLESYWILNWFEFLFNTANEDNCPIRVGTGSQNVKHWEIANLRCRYIENSICEASILALKFLRGKVEKRIQTKPQEETGRYTTTKHQRESCLWKLYERTLKVIIDAVLEKMWPK